MTFDHDDLGIDLDRIRALPECAACRKKSDGHKKAPDGTILCGRHFDEWAMSRYVDGSKPKITAADFAANLRSTTYRACWEAKIEE